MTFRDKDKKTIYNTTVWLLDYAATKNINYMFTDLSNKNSIAIPSCQLILINTNLDNIFELPFIIAHEISHVLFNHERHCDCNKAFEEEADFGALVLLQFYAISREPISSNAVFETCHFPKRIAGLVQRFQNDVKFYNSLDDSACSLSCT